MPGTFSYTVSTNTVAVTGGTSGSPADFASFVTADRAGTGTSLLAARAPAANVTLTYAVRPVELRAIVTKFIVAAKTAEADYLFITGTDAWDAAQTESIDVTAGNGTYTSTKRWRTITNIDCSDNAAGGGTVWADGTIAVTQDIWGVIWDKGNGQYQIDSKFNIGDASTATYFKDTLKQVIFTNISGSSLRVMYIYTNATFHSGTKGAGGDSGYNGCEFYWKNTGAAGSPWLFDKTGTGIIYLYGTTIKADVAYTYFESSEAIGCTIGSIHTGSSNEISINNLYVNPIYAINGPTSTGTYSNMIVLDALDVISFSGSGISKIKGLRAYDNTRAWNYNSFSGTGYAINCYFETYTIHTGSHTGNVYRQITLDIEVQDELGNAISGAACTLTDVASGVVWNAEVTDANGNIAATGEDGSGETNSISYKRYYYSGSSQIETFGPWTLTVSKAGYKTETVFIGTDEAELWEANLGGKIPVTLSRAGIPPYFTEYAND